MAATFDPGSLRPEYCARKAPVNVSLVVRFAHALET